MITSVEFTDVNDCPHHYIKDVFKNGDVFNFKDGVNIIIGKNGSGKSTLLNLISMYTLCETTMMSAVPSNAIEYPRIFKDDNTVYNGVLIHHDYISKVFKYKPAIEMNNDEAQQNFTNFNLYINTVKASCGEGTMVALNCLFNELFGKNNYEYPIKKLQEIADSSNDVWKANITSLLNYYKANRCKLNNWSITVLLDEPDRNLDIDNIQQLYGILSYQKENTQLICVIHNPMLIYKLSKVEHINFVELTEGYLDSIKKFIEGDKD